MTKTKNAVITHEHINATVSQNAPGSANVQELIGKQCYPYWNSNGNAFRKS